MLRKWLRKLSHRSVEWAKQKSVTGQPASRCLALETLEDRVTPTVVFDNYFGAESQKQNGGSSLSSPPIYLIFWGSYWGSATSPQAQAITAAAKEVIASPYFSEVEQYGSRGVPTFAGVAYDSSNPVSGFAQGQSFFSSAGSLEAVVQNQVYRGPLPRPNTPANLPIYVVITPPGITSAVNDAGGYNFIDHEFDPSLDYLSFADVWCSTNYSNTPSTLSADAFSTYFSHEIAESMSDPGGGGFEVNPGAKWTGGGSGNQIGDYEGNFLNYRLADGALVQPLWSRENDNWVVADGNSQNFYVSTTAADWKGSSFQGTYDTLTVVGSQESFGFDDSIVVNSVQIGGSPYLQVTENGQSVQFLAGTVKNLVIDANNAFDTVDIIAAPGSPNIVINDTGPGEATITTQAAATIDVSAGIATVVADAATTINAGNQTVILSGSGNVVLNGTSQTNVQVLQVAGTATIDNAALVQVGDGLDSPMPGSTVTVNGDATTQIQVFSLGGKLVVANAAASIDVGMGLTSLTTGLVDIALTKGTTSLTVDDSHDLSERDCYIRASTVGSFNIPLLTYSAAHLSSLTFKAGFDDYVFVGGDSIGTLPSLIDVVGEGNENLVVDGTGSPNSLFAVNASSVQCYSTTIGRGIALHALTNAIQYSKLASLKVVGDSTAATAFDVVGANPSTPVSLLGGAAADTFEIGSTTSSLGAIQSTISVNGNGGADTLVVDDRQPPTSLTVIRSRSFEVTNQAITWSETTGISLHPIPITDTFQYTNIPNILLDGNSIGTNFSVQSTAVGSTVSIVAGSGNDSVSLGDRADSLDGILGPVVVNGGGGNNSLVYNDAASTNPESYTINGFQLSRGAVSLGQFSNFQQVTLQTSQGSDSVAVAAVPSAGLSLDGGSGQNTLGGPNTTNTWTLTDSNSGLLDTTIAFRGFADLRGGSGNDTFTMNSAATVKGIAHTGGSLTGSLDGGGGTNVLDYSPYLANIVVDLQLGSETGLNQITNIQEVIGSQGNDILVGNGGVTLQGGTGLNILIAGPSPAKLLGNANQDILIGGTTDYDLNITALKAILSEWTRTDLDTKSDPTGYKARVNHLLNGNGLNGADLLNLSTFHANVGGNRLMGASGIDLFYGSKKRDTNDWNPAIGEQFIEDGTQQDTQIDARSVPLSELELDGTEFPTSAVQSLLLAPGTHTLSEEDSTVSITFTVAADGTVDYDPTLDDILSGRGTTTLAVHGTTITIDATRISTGTLVLNDEIDVNAAEPYAFTAFPGTYSLTDENATGASVAFSVGDNGTVSYAQDLQGILTGVGTATLGVAGRTVTLDLSQLSESLLDVDDIRIGNNPPAASSFTALPGTFVLQDPEAEGGATFDFTIERDGTIGYDPTLEGILTGAGTTTLAVHGISVTLDLTHLSMPFMVLDQNYVYNTAPFTFEAIPGTYTLQDTEALQGGSVNFTVAADGTVQYDPTLEGILTGAGSSTLVVHGVTVTVDTTHLSIPSLTLEAEIPVLNTAPFAFSCLPGTFSLEDAFSVSDASVNFSVNADGTVSYDPSLEGVVTGAGTAALTVQGETVTVDPTQLSSPLMALDEEIDLGNSAPLAFTALPGTYTIQDDEAVGAQVQFTVSASDAVSYDPSLEGILTGAGTSTLAVHGISLTIDATHLSLQTLYVDDAYCPLPAQPFNALPGQYSLSDPQQETALQFTINQDGTVGYDPSLEGVFAGSGTNTLAINGVTVTIDATQLSVPTLIVDNAIRPATSAPFTFTGLPGAITIADPSEGASVSVTLGADGTVGYDPSLEGVLTGQGTSTLVIRGVSATIDAEPLSVQQLSVDGSVFASTSEPISFTGLPGLVDFGDYEGEGATLLFTLNINGTVAYDPSLQGILSGSGTNVLQVEGVAVTIDATALSPQISTFAIAGVGTFSTAQVQTILVLPGAAAFQAGSTAFDFTISTQDQLGYDSSLDAIVSGRGSNTLTLLGPG